MAPAAQAVAPRPPRDPPADQEANYPNGRQTDNGGGSFPCLTLLGFLFLTFNSGMAIYRSQGDMMAISSSLSPMET
uniref:Uncharacterized protein n=1 Tax=Arundo donax TaxID=35708 RepID=A0A0A8YS07_ARUDO